MRILVTGGAGFIGSTYVRAVLDGRYPAYAGAEVVVLALPSPPVWRSPSGLALAGPGAFGFPIEPAERGG